MTLRLASEVRQGTSGEGEGREKKQWLGSHHVASCLASCRRRRGEERTKRRDEFHKENEPPTTRSCKYPDRGHGLV